MLVLYDIIPFKIFQVLFAYFCCSFEILKLCKKPQKFSQKILIEYGGGGA